MKKPFLIIPILLVSALVFSACTQSDEVKEAFNKGYSQAEQQINQDEFSKDEALVKVQNYKIAVDLDAHNNSKGQTILEDYKERGKIPAIDNIGWFVEELEPGKYQVSYKQKIDYLESNPRWEVTKDEIKALNGSAITITPELGPQEKEVQGTDLEKQVHQMFDELYKKYEAELFEKFEMPTGDQLKEIESKALTETATKFNITSDEVGEIFTRLNMQKYQE